jgi:hypothetical protein
MWVRRTPEEVARWDAITRREAHRNGLGMAILVWVTVPLLAAGGWYYTRAGVIQHGVAGSFASRWSIFAVLVAPFCYWIYRREKGNEVAKAYRRTICPECDIAADGNAGAICQCGDTFVAQREMKWVEQGPVRGHAGAESSEPGR